MKILITGGCGFVGSNLALSMKTDFEDAEITVFDNLKRRGSELNLPVFKRMNISFVHGDIRNEEDFENFEQLDFIIDASAEPSVLAGLDGGQKQLININLFGTVNILNLALKCKAGLIFLSTSRVYPIEELNKIKIKEAESRFDIDGKQSISGISEFGIDENFPLNGYRSIYGASKLASELIIQEYQHFYNLKSVINRCGVIAGPRQMGKVDQGVTVLWLARHFWSKPLSYIGFGGSGKQVRDVLHIDDLYRLIKRQILDIEKYNKGLFNVGGGLDCSFSLKELTAICEEVTGNKININLVTETRDADIPIYITNNKKITEFSNWKPEKTVRNIIEDIHHWLSGNEEDLRLILN